MKDTQIIIKEIVMKKVIVLGLLILFANCTFADTWVNGYTRRDGTYVQGHYRSSPNYTRMDNYSTRGNYNPYTGKTGTVNPYNQYGSAYNNRYDRCRYSYGSYECGY